MNNLKIISGLLLSMIALFSTFVSAQYSNELNQAYNYAYINGITTMDSIQKADMDWKLNRIAMAKMITNYAVNVLWLEIPNNNGCTFADVSSSLNSDYDNWVTNACKLGLMWQNMPNNKFRPYDTVTRAEFGTTLSRAIHKALGNNLSDWNPYYSTHLSYLNSESIMNYIDHPEMTEQRWYVMLMMMRASKLASVDFDAGECFSDCFNTPDSWDFDANEIFECLQTCIK